MTAVYKSLDLARLRLLLHYDQETGVFMRGNPPSIAGTIHPSGYRLIAVDGRRTYAHRLAWFYVYGDWPDEIDHINGNRDDNRIANLRLATRSEQMSNSNGHRDRTLPFKGVRISRSGRYEALIQINGKRRYLGTYGTLEEAKAAYDTAAKAAFGPFARVK